MEPNLNYIKQLANGDEVFEKRFIEILKTEFPVEEEEYLQNMSSRQLEAAAMNVHKLKHKLGILGLEEDYELAVRHEEALLEADTQWEGDFHQTMIKIGDFIKSL